MHCFSPSEVGSTAAPTATSSAAAAAAGGLGFMQKPLGVTTAASTALSGKSCEILTLESVTQLYSWE